MSWVPARGGDGIRRGQGAAPTDARYQRKRRHVRLAADLAGARAMFLRHIDTACRRDALNTD